MKQNAFLLIIQAALLLLGSCLSVSAQGRPGTVVWSDGHKVTGTISLSPGKDLRLFTSTGQVSVQLDRAKEIVFAPEKEEMREGFYFPTAGQATQAKTGEVYPVRYLVTAITLADGTKLEGHLFTTTVYVETDDNTEKVVLMAKQTGENGQKLSDVLYPTSIEFNDSTAATGASRIDLSQTGFPDSQPPVILGRPDLAALPAQQVPGQSVWTVPGSGFLFSVQASDGFHVAWPADQADSTTTAAIQKALTDMRDFYDTRTLLGCFADGDAGDVYSLVMMKRVGTTYGYDANTIPWSLVILRWKYDPAEKKATLLNRASLGMGRSQGSLPVVLKSAALLMNISPQPTPPAAGSTP